MRLLIATAAAVAALTLTATAGASYSHGLTKHDRQVIRFFQHHPRAAASPEGGRILSRLLPRALAEIRSLQAVPPDCRGGASPAACAWYFDGATQCEVSYEGGWTSVSPDGTYHGRFQMDYSFQTETPFGRAMEARYGHAENWPPWAQIQHAYEVWSYSGWSRWPPYHKYGCGAWQGRAYT